MPYSEFVLGIKGEPVLLRAFTSKAEEMGWDIADVWDISSLHSLRVYWDTDMKPSAVSGIRTKSITEDDWIYTLPQQWGEAIEAITF